MTQATAAKDLRWNMLRRKGGHMNNHTRIARLEHVGKRYGEVVALDGIDLDIHRGELLALLGPNGAGKSTCIGLLLGLHRADSGTVTLFGEDPQDIAPRRRIGVMLQAANLPATLKVGELLRLTASYYPDPRPLAECAALAGVADLLGRRYGALSGGQQRRVQFAMAMAGRPEILFLDEPTVGMDITARQSLWAAIRQLVAGGCAVVLTTHYLEEAEALADRVCVIAKGRVVSEGSVDALRARGIAADSLPDLARSGYRGGLAGRRLGRGPGGSPGDRDHPGRGGRKATTARRPLAVGAGSAARRPRRGLHRNRPRRRCRTGGCMTAIDTAIDRAAAITMTPGRLVDAYVQEAKAECLRYLRNPGFLLPTLLFPSVFYVMFGIFLGHANSADAPRYLLASMAPLASWRRACSASAYRWHWNATAAC